MHVKNNCRLCVINRVSTTDYLLSTGTLVFIQVYSGHRGLLEWYSGAYMRTCTGQSRTLDQ